MQEVKLERTELERSQERGIWDRWGVPAATRLAQEDGWLFFALQPRSIYAPMEHAELPNQFAATANDEPALLQFVQAYGQLGWQELRQSNYIRPDNSWLKAATSASIDLTIRYAETWPFAEPIDWAFAHAHTVSWCLKAGRAIKLVGRSRLRECKALASQLPNPFGVRSYLTAEPLAREKTRDKLEVVDFVGKMLEDYLWINLRGVRLRVQYRQGKLNAMWGGDSLLESIYSLVTNSATRGNLAQCESCGAVFIQTDARQRFCPPRPWQTKSTCMNRERVRRWRKKPKGTRKGNQ